MWKKNDIFQKFVDRLPPDVQGPVKALTIPFFTPTTQTKLFYHIPHHSGATAEKKAKIC